MNRQEEQFVIDKFREEYANIPEGEINSMLPPWTDFVLITKSGKKIGIELTQAVHSEEAKRFSSDQKKFTDLVLEKLIPVLPFHFSLNVTLFVGIGIRKMEKNKIATEVAIFCEKEFSTLKDKENARVEHVGVDFDSAIPVAKEHFIAMGYRNLPKGVKMISITRYDEHGSSFNSNSEAASIPIFTKDRLDDILADKEGKLEFYMKCDEYWLIIWQGGGITGYFQEEDIRTPLQSKFKKVFIVRTMGDLIILKP